MPVWGLLLVQSPLLPPSRIATATIEGSGSIVSLPSGVIGEMTNGHVDQVPLTSRTRPSCVSARENDGFLAL
jgi:hypothetical protein